MGRRASKNKEKEGEESAKDSLYKQRTALVDYLRDLQPRRDENRVRQVTTLDKVLHRTAFSKPLAYYFTSGRKVRCPRVVEKEPPPYFIDAQQRYKEKDHTGRISKLPNLLKPSHRDKPVIGLNDRLHIPQEDPDYPAPKMATTFAPDYYKSIEGSPFEESSFNKQQYIDRLKKTFFTRLNSAIKEEVQYMEEERKLRELCYLISKRNEYVTMVDLFNEFLFKSMDERWFINKLAVNMAKLVEMKVIQIKMAFDSLDSIRGSLYEMDNVLCYRRTCKMTLDEIEIRMAPEYWKRKYEKEKVKLMPIANKAADYVLQMFAYFKLELPLPDESLEQLVLRLANTIRTLGPPARFFKYPSEVDLAMKKLEHSTVMAIQTLLVSSKSRDELVEKDKEFEREEKKSLDMLRVEVDITKNEFNRRLSQIISVEEETGVIMSYWRAVTTNPDLLQTFVHIKCLHEEFVGGEAPTKDIVEMLSALAERIVDAQMRVNSLPDEEVKRIYDDLKSEDDMEMQRALAARKLKIETEKMLKNMKQYFENRFSHPGLPHHFKVLPVQKPKVKREIPLPITPPDKRILKNALRIFQPTLSQEACLNFMESIRNLEKIEDKLDIVKFPPMPPTLVKPDYSPQPIPPVHINFFLDEKLPDDLYSSSSYVKDRKEEAAEKCSLTELLD